MWEEYLPGNFFRLLHPQYNENAIVLDSDGWPVWNKTI